MDPQQQQRQGNRAGQPPPGRVGAFSFVFLFIMIAVIASISSNNSSLAMVHQVPEGHVGAYWRGGALMKKLTDPGFHLMIPLITKYEPIQVTIQTDQVRDIPCGTKGGVMITFDKIEVVNRLRKDYVYETLLEYGVHYDKTWIYDKIHHEINQFCSSHTLQQVYIDMFDLIDEQMKDAIQKGCSEYAPGIEIIGVRVTKPNIPASIKRNFEQMEEERTKKKIALSQAEKNAQVSLILMEQKLMEKDSIRRQETIENEMFLAREKSQTDASFYRVMKEAEANKLKLTPEFLELKFIESIANNTKIFFGNKVPSMILDQRLLGSLLRDKTRNDHLDEE
ncbi:uncharacterized protein LOC144551910 isoform X2 [Carex rostrata]